MNEEKAKFFDLHVTGLGYVNQVREIRPKEGEPFLAVEIAALRGSAAHTSLTRFDCRVSGTEAKVLIQRLAPDIEAEHRVLVGFKLTDPFAETFTYQSGKRKGETGVRLKARLLGIDWAKVDGETVYRRPGNADESTRVA